MLCPKCNKASTKRERAGGKCPQCGRAFRLEVADATWISDYEVEKAVAQLSQNGAHKFTRAQLTCQIERHLVRHKQQWVETMLHAITPNTPAPWVLGGLAVAFAVLFFFLGIVVPGVILVAAGAVFLFYGMQRSTPEQEREKFEAERSARDGRTETVVATYLGAGDVAGLLPTKRWLAQDEKRERREFDLHSFGFDRVVVVQGDDTVEMLVANRFHFEHNAAIVSFSGYPQHVAEIVREQMERGHTRAHVLLLHDASAEGYVLAERWRQSGWGARASITRVGLTPRQVKRLLPVYPPQRGFELPAWVPPEDAAWLSAASVPLAALRPVQTMTLLFNAIHEIETRSDVGDTVFVGFDSASDSSYDFG